MVAALTVMALRLDFGAAVDSIEESCRAKGLSLQVEGPRESWSLLTVTGPRGSLRISGMRWERPGDEFSSMTLGMANYFRCAPATNKDLQLRAMRFVHRCEFALGIVAKPEFSEQDGHFDLVFALATALDALIWNGSGLVDTNGRLVLDGDGTSEPGALIP